jgi:hypothetical protein
MSDRKRQQVEQLIEEVEEMHARQQAAPAEDKGEGAHEQA